MSLCFSFQSLSFFFLRHCLQDGTNRRQIDSDVSGKKYKSLYVTMSICRRNDQQTFPSNFNNIYQEILALYNTTVLALGKARFLLPHRHDNLSKICILPSLTFPNWTCSSGKCSVEMLKNRFIEKPISFKKWFIITTSFCRVGSPLHSFAEDTQSDHSKLFPFNALRGHAWNSLCLKSIS